MKSIQERLQSASRKWKLTDLEAIYEMPGRAVYAAESADYGSVIVKRNHDISHLSGEFETLRRMKGNSCCQVYDFDGKEGMILEERILPGTVLREEAFWEKRAEVFARVFRGIHVILENETSYPSYLDWVKNAYEKLRKGPSADKRLVDGMREAVAVAEEMFAKYPQRMLLHGDLHHDNILQNEQGGYVVVDPKGVVGPPVFDTPRYVLNEMDEGGDSLPGEHILKVVGKISELLEYPVEDLRLLFFMETMLANAWSFGGGEEIEEDAMEVAERVVKGAKT